MTDSNNVVIKINYKGSGKSPYKRTENEMVTEWHYKRIVFAVILFLIFIAFPFYYFSDESVEQKAEQVTGVPEVKTVVNNILNIVDKESVESGQVKAVEKDVNTSTNNAIKSTKKEQAIIEIEPINIKPAEKIKKEEKNKTEINPSQSLSVDKRIARALLTTGISNKEPLGIIASPVIVSKNKATAVFYFTEIVDMKGLYLYHRWLWNDQIQYNRKINILGDRWRAATSKTISYAKAGNWSVRLVNNGGIILNEIRFKVIQQ